MEKDSNPTKGADDVVISHKPTCPNVPSKTRTNKHMDIGLVDTEEDTKRPVPYDLCLLLLKVWSLETILDFLCDWVGEVASKET